MLETARRLEFMALEHFMPKGHEPKRDVLKNSRRITNFSRGHTESVVIKGMVILHKLPKTLALQRELWLLDAQHIKMIGTILEAAPSQSLAAIDELLEHLLTPTMPAQSFPDHTAFRKRINQILITVNPELKADPDPAPQPPFDLDLPDQDEEGLAELHAEFSKPDGLILDEALRSIAHEHHCSREDAFYKLIFENIEVKLTLNIYQAQDIPDAPAWISGVGWITGELRDRLLANVTKARDLAGYKDVVSNSYRPSEGVKAYLEGRDGTCGVPGCTVPAHRCQKDHRVEYAEGGETSARNLVDVCSFDHNHKTNGGLHYVLDPETGTTIWLHTDGTFEIGLATGPLSPQGKWEAKTIAQYMKESSQRAYKRRLNTEANPTHTTGTPTNTV